MPSRTAFLTMRRAAALRTAFFTRLADAAAFFADRLLRGRLARRPWRPSSRTPSSAPCGRPSSRRPSGQPSSAGLLHGLLGGGLLARPPCGRPSSRPSSSSRCGAQPSRRPGPRGLGSRRRFSGRRAASVDGLVHVVHRASHAQVPARAGHWVLARPYRHARKDICRICARAYPQKFQVVRTISRRNRIGHVVRRCRRCGNACPDCACPRVQGLDCLRQSRE